MDKFYHHSTAESILTVARLTLQGLDTLIHAFVLRDLIASEHIGVERAEFLHTLFVVWVVHAALNQFFLCSTATLMVQTWNALSMRSQPLSAEATVVSMCDTSDDETESDGDNNSTDEEVDDGQFIVRRLLRPGRVSEHLKGKQGAASSGVDTAIRIETTLAINATVYMLGFADVPLRILLFSPETVKGIDLKQLIVASLPYAWLLLNSLFAFLLLLSPPTKRMLRHKEGQALDTSRLRFLRNTIDVLIIVIGTYRSGASFQTKALAHLLGAGITAKSFLKASKWSAPKSFWQATGVLELAMRISVGRRLIPGKHEDAAMVGAVATIVSAAYAMMMRSEGSSQYIPTPKEVVDVAFLGHPAELHDCWALWLLPYSLEARWQRPWWIVPLWPIHYLVGYYTCHWRRKIFGDEASFFGCDDVLYGKIRMQTWTSCHFGRHFFTSSGAVKLNIEAAARHAEHSGLKVLALGALNKAEGINRGGASVALALGPKRKLSIIHGNHLTAAAVVETIRQCFGEKAKVFLTGASSKVGWAVAQALKDRFEYEVLCHSTDEARRAIFRERGFGAASTLEEGMSFTNLWIVGKYDRAVAETIPQGSTAIVFAVPHPLQDRKDVRVVEAGNLHVDLSKFDRPRQFTNKLASHEIFACHAAGIVAASRLRNGEVGQNGRIDEIGAVDPKTMDCWLEDAKRLGFTVPRVRPVDTVSLHAHDLTRTVSMGMPPVIVVGAGPSGLAVAALLRMKGIRSIVLEEQSAHDGYGSWDMHFTKLEVTTSKSFCSLPGYSMNNRDFPGEHVNATQYINYLHMYAQRFQLDIRRGHQVREVVRSDESAPWIVQCEEPMKSFRASVVVIATGKHRLPRRDADNGLLPKLRHNGIEAAHSTDMRDPKIWARATEAAEKGKLCIVGFGNSAADIATSILQKAKGEEKCIHIATRTVPPVFPRRKGFLRVDAIGFYVRLLPDVVQELFTMLLWWGVPDSAKCNAAFPSNVPRWRKLAGRVPVIDKSGAITRALEKGSLVGHGPIVEVLRKEIRGANGDLVVSDSSLQFEDGPDAPGSEALIDFVIMATGYEKQCIVTRDDPLNGLFLCGFGNDFLLPIRSISENAAAIAMEIESTVRFAQ
jgi:hypothetical protein